MNTFMNSLNDAYNWKLTENGGLAHRTTNSKVYDMFALGAAYRSRSDADVLKLFTDAFHENEELALKCLFYIRDCRGGQGERRFFRVCLKWLAENRPERIKNLIQYLPEYGRYDDWFVLFETPLQKYVMADIAEQLKLDMTSQKNGISLLAKWLPSENASSKETIKRAKKIRDYLGITSKQYRLMLSKLREKILVLERLMSTNRWDEIEFDKIPSKAGLVYKNAFARRDIIAKKYEAFAKDKTTKVNATTLYPYEVVAKALKDFSIWSYGRNRSLTSVDRDMVNKYWENLPDYFDGKASSLMCVVDTSGSMTGVGVAAPINVAIGLGLYCAERLNGPFKNHYISFSSRPQLIETSGYDFVDKVERIYKTNLCENTNLTGTFDMLLQVATRPGVKKEDIPKTLVVISDMEINSGAGYRSKWSRGGAATEMEKVRQKWAGYGLEVPRLIYWNVDARHNTILDSGPNVSFVSGMSPTIFKQVITGKNGYDLMIEAICSPRYEVIK